MEQQEAKARIKHVMRTLIAEGMSTKDVSALSTEAYGEIVREHLFNNRQF